MATETEATKALIRRHVETMNRGDVEEFDKYCSDDYKWLGVEPERMGEATNLRDFKSAIKDLVETLPDLYVEIIDMVAEGEKVAVHITLAGHHTGRPFMGVEPSGVYVKWHGYSTYSIKNGIIYSESFFDDTFAIAKSLGSDS
jgi:predicted ester cyclase